MLSVFEVLPLAPMRRVRENELHGFPVDPAAENTAARKGEPVSAVVADDSQFQIAIKRRGGQWLPLHDAFSPTNLTRQPART